MPAENDYEFQDLMNEIPANANLKLNCVFIEILFYFYESFIKVPLFEIIHHVIMMIIIGKAYVDINESASV